MNMYLQEGVGAFIRRRLKSVGIDRAYSSIEPLEPFRISEPPCADDVFADTSLVSALFPPAAGFLLPPL